MEYFNTQYNQIKKEVDALIATTPSAALFESKKANILSHSKEYVDYLAAGLRTTPENICATLEEINSDLDFFGSMSDGLQEISTISKQIHTGEIRIHAHTIYVAVRILKPSVMVETGVANGKSSAFILRAMDLNQKGKLYSIDLPTYNTGNKDEERDLALIPLQREPGWLVPQSLRSRWDLRLGDARKLLPALKSELNQEIDIFMHDSLHSYEHMKWELALAKTWIKKTGTILCDDIQNNLAFEEAAQGIHSASFGTFGFLWLA